MSREFRVDVVLGSKPEHGSQSDCELKNPLLLCLHGRVMQPCCSSFVYP